METFESVKHNADLFAFLLFDERSAHDALRNFAVDSFEWLDSLAAASKMYVFVPISLDDQEVTNPSLKVANMFGINANQLPGFVLFTLAEDKKGVGKGSYFPLEPSVFEQDLDHAQSLIADLFSIVQKSQRDSISAEHLLGAVTSELNSLQKREELRPLRNWMRSLAFAVAQAPRDILKSMAEAFGTQIAKQIGG